MHRQGITTLLHDGRGNDKSIEAPRIAKVRVEGKKNMEIKHNILIANSEFIDWLVAYKER